MSKDKDMLEILLKNVLNMHTKINEILDILEYEEHLKTDINLQKDDIVIDMEQSQYQQMCDLMDRKVIPFMGIA